MKILAIETSCDETAVAILEAKGGSFRILSSVVSSQVKIHAKWGGVVPWLAKREHQANLITVLRKALREAKLLNPKLEIRNPKQIQNSKYKIINTILEREAELLEKTIAFLKKYQAPKIDLIAVVNGPGLEPALWVGVNFAKALATAWNKPIMPVNHLEGHLFSVFLPKEKKWFKINGLKFPAILLLVSGGHTQIVLVKNYLKYKLIGQTRDDAAGEAFDKVAKMLNLGYPGGPAISKLASNYRGSTSIVLPRPMMKTNDYDFSFSGLKTAVLYKLKEPETRVHERVHGRVHVAQAICHEFQEAVIDVLISKTLRAVKEYKAKTVILGGGVAANGELRNQLSSQLKAISSELNFLAPARKFTGDNAAMTALSAYFRQTKKPGIKNTDRTFKTLKANGNLPIAS